MSTQSTLTVTGFVGSSVRFSVGQEGGVPYASFRLGSTQRVFDRATQAYKDTPTQWYTVKVWRQVATNVVQSLRKGDPVVVTGRLRTQEWANLEGAHTTLVLEATALGHDLVFGTTRLERTLGPGAHRSGQPAPEDAVDVSSLPEAPPLADPGDDAPDEGAGASSSAAAAGIGGPSEGALTGADPDDEDLDGDDPDGEDLDGDDLDGDDLDEDDPDEELERLRAGLSGRGLGPAGVD